MLDPSTPTASSGTVITCSRSQSSIIISAVIIFVVLAIGNLASALRLCKILPVESSITLSALPSAKTGSTFGVCTKNVTHSTAQIRQKQKNLVARDVVDKFARLFNKRIYRLILHFKQSAPLSVVDEKALGLYCNYRAVAPG